MKPRYLAAVSGMMIEIVMILYARIVTIYDPEYMDDLKKNFVQW